MNSDPSSITLRQVQTAADSFLATYHSSLELPIPIDEIIEVKLGIRLVLIDCLERNFGVNAFIAQDFKTIVVDEKMFVKQPRRVRFTLAEEIGHQILHKDWYCNNGPRGMEDYINWQESIEPELFSRIERQAKTFASMVLMPHQSITQDWKLMTTKYNLTEPCDVYDLPDTFASLADKYEVSVDSMLVRLSVLKLVTMPQGFLSNRK